VKVLTAAQMRQVDHRTIERGIPGIVLMENAGHRVVEFLSENYGPLDRQRIVVLCGKGNNGGDGLVVARELFTRFRPVSLDVVLAADPQSMQGDAAQNLKMLEAAGCPVARELAPPMRAATIVIDALLGTGLSGPATGRILDLIRETHSGFPLAKIMAVDIPSGLPSDSPFPAGEFVHADATVTFTAPKIAHALPPNCNHMGKLVVSAIGSPPQLFEQDPDVTLSLTSPDRFRHLLAPRARGAHKGHFGHVLVIGGAAGKTGAAAMAGMSALRAGAGLVTVACTAPDFTALCPELMTQRLPGDPTGMDVIAIGPGLGQQAAEVDLVRRAVAEWPQPMIVDADGLNALASAPWTSAPSLRVLTPHPGEMSRLCGKRTAEILENRVDIARSFAVDHRVCLVLKGERTLVAHAGGEVWINPTGTPAMATGGSGDVLTGLIAGFLAQFPESPEQAIAAAVYLHGLAGEIGARRLGEKPLIATDLLADLPAAIHDAADRSN
jgi:ADP-dependent NAD(P)H-hydrate dehydratase / NAD(P)H-hydrate epimerase